MGLAESNTYQPQLYRVLVKLEYAVVWSDPHVIDEISAPWRPLIIVGRCRSSASPWPSCPSSPRPHEHTKLSAVYVAQQHQISHSITEFWELRNKKKKPPQPIVYPKLMQSLDQELWMNCSSALCTNTHIVKWVSQKFRDRDRDREKGGT